MNVKNIDIKKIRQTENVRTRYDEDPQTAELMDNIKQLGLLQPIGVVKSKTNGNYDVLFGNRRFIAMKKLGRSSIQANIFTDKTDAEFLVLNLVENLQRKNISVTELGRIFFQLRSLGLTSSEIAARLSIPASRVKMILKCGSGIPKKYMKYITNMGPGIKAKKGKIAASLAMEILSLDKTFRIGAVKLDKLFEKSREDGFSVNKIKLLMGLMSEGYTFDNALVNVDKKYVFNTTIVVDKNKIERLQKKYKLTKAKLCRGILSGKIKERI